MTFTRKEVEALIDSLKDFDNLGDPGVNFAHTMLKIRLERASIAQETEMVRELIEREFPQSADAN